MLYCCFCKNVYHFEEDDLMWINVYSVGDTVKLKTTNGYDLLCMTKKEVFDKKSPFIENEGQDVLGDYNAVAYYEGFFIHNSTKVYYMFSNCSDELKIKIKNEINNISDEAFEDI